MSHHEEYRKARETLTLSMRTASSFQAQLGALAPILIPPLPAAHFGRRPGFPGNDPRSQVLIARLYEMVTYEELTYSLQTKHPGFSLHFIPVFYGMYYDALHGFQNELKIASLWQTHFKGPPAVKGKQVAPGSMDAVEFSVRTGAIAHIKGDMPLALAKAYQTWATKSKPKFQDLREDFIDKSEGAFRKAQACFYLDVNDKTFSPLRPELGQFAAAVYQHVGDIQPSLDKMFQWRRDAWDQAAQSL
jgi:hypothetical protein